MVNSIGNSLQQFIGHRVNEITEYLMATNSTYKTLSNQCSQHFIQIQEYLPSDQSRDRKTPAYQSMVCHSFDRQGLSITAASVGALCAANRQNKARR